MCRLLMLCLLLCPTGLLAAPDEPEDRKPAHFDPALSAELQAWLNRYADAYNRQDYAALLNMWDADFAGPIYIAEEVDPPLHGWERLRRYFNPVPGRSMLDAIRNEYSAVRATPLGPDLALASYRLRYAIKVRGQPAMAGWDRVLAVFRKRDGDWRLLAYAEAPMSPLTMLRRLLQDAVPADFAAGKQSAPAR